MSERHVEPSVVRRPAFNPGAGASWTAAVVALAIGGIVIAPRLAPLAALVIALRLSIQTNLWPSTTRLRSYHAILVALMAYWAVTCLWSPRPMEGLPIVGALGLLSIACLSSVETAEALSDRALRPAAMAMLGVFCIAAAIGAFEEVTQFAIRHYLFSHWPRLQPTDVLLRVNADGSMTIPSYMSNRNIAALAFLVWPALLIARTYARRPWQIGASALAFALFGVAVWLSEHQTSKAALAISLVAFAAVAIGKTRAVKALYVGWVALCLLTVPVVLMFDHWGLARSDKIQLSGQHRVIIWRETAVRVFDRPLLGHGFDATRQVSRDEVSGKLARSVPATQSSNPTIAASTDAHAHNVYLQVWYETGAIGALLVMLAGLPAIHRMTRASEAVQPYLAAGFSLGAVMAALSWSLTTHWFPPLFGIATAMLALAWTGAERRQLREHEVIGGHGGAAPNA